MACTENKGNSCLKIFQANFNSYVETLVFTWLPGGRLSLSSWYSVCLYVYTVSSLIGVQGFKKYRSLVWLRKIKITQRVMDRVMLEVSLRNHIRNDVTKLCMYVWCGGGLCLTLNDLELSMLAIKSTFHKFELSFRTLYVATCSDKFRAVRECPIIGERDCPALAGRVWPITHACVPGTEMVPHWAVLFSAFHRISSSSSNPGKGIWLCVHRCLFLSYWCFLGREVSGLE